MGQELSVGACQLARCNCLMHASLACALFEQPGCNIKNARAAAAATTACHSCNTSGKGGRGATAEPTVKKPLAGYVAWRCVQGVPPTRTCENKPQYLWCNQLPLPRAPFISGNALTGHKKRMRQPRATSAHKTQSSIKMQGGHLTQRQRRLRRRRRR